MAPSHRSRSVVHAIVGMVFATGFLVSLAGDLEPPGPPAPTMAHLIRADDLPLTITVPGSYALAEDITTSGGGIIVSADGVTIDLRGHALTGGTGDGISTGASVMHTVVKNGTIRNWGGDGIDFQAGGAQGSIVTHVAVQGNLGDGIKVSTQSVISNCVASFNGVDGFEGNSSGGTIVDSTAMANGVNGFLITAGAWEISHCSAGGNTGTGIAGTGSGTTIFGCTARDNNGDGLTVGTGGSILSSSAFSNGDSAGDDGIVASLSSTVRDCTSISNFEDGIEAAAGSVVRGNNARTNGGAGINVTGGASRIEENNVTGNLGDGINANPATGCFLLRNSASGNAVNFDFAAGNSYGAIVAGSAGFTNSNSWANYTY